MAKCHVVPKIFVIFYSYFAFVIFTTVFGNIFLYMQNLIWFSLDENLDVFDVKVFDYCSYNIKAPVQTTSGAYATHIIFGLQKKFSSKPFSFFHYLSIIAAAGYGQNQRIMFHDCFYISFSPFLKRNKSRTF